MYSEIGFIFNPSLSLSNNNNTGNIYDRRVSVASAKPDPNTSQGLPTGTNQGQTGQSPTAAATHTATDAGVLVFKNKSATGTLGVKNYLKDNVYKYDASNEDPYIALIRYFGENKTKALKLKAGDFAYLKDLGVYPINRLWILRRFPDNCVVPNNLLDWGKSAAQPISTVIGWMKDKDDNPMMTLSFSEVWTDQNEMIDKVLTQMLETEFKFKLPAVMSIPGWSQGILFGMLDAMGLTGDFSARNVPTGNPNVLRTGKMREINAQGLKSTMPFTLETCYEQKYINGIDPGMAMMDVISNLLRMGTSDQKFVLSNSTALQQLVGNLNQNSPTVDAWVSFITKLVTSFVQGVTNFITEMKTHEDQGSKEDKTTGGTDNASGTSGTSGTSGSSGVAASGTDVALAGVNAFSSLALGLMDSLLAGTIMKYRWPLKGSIGLMSGISTTPWHLTIGNPYSPIINIGNILVGGVDIKLSNDLGFNDMPARIDVTINTEFGRPLGKQELEKMFNNGYKRVYSSKSIDSLSETEVTNDTSATGKSTVDKVLDSGKQPTDTKKAYMSSGGNTYPISVPKNP